MMQTDRKEKLLRIKNRQGRTVRVVREIYLREDVPCGSPECISGCSQTEFKNQLDAEAPYYVFPDSGVTKDYMEILEFPEIVGLVFTQTVSSLVQREGGRRLHTRLNNIVKDPRRGSVVFCNEFQKYASRSRKPGETIDSWQLRCTYAAAEWYYDHLAGKIAVVVLTENKQFVEEHKCKRQDVFVITIQTFLDNFWPNLTAAHDLLDSLTASLQDIQVKDREFSGYMSDEILESNLKSGRFIQGCLQVNKHNAQQEAFVHQTNETGVKDDTHKTSDVLIPGVAARNRAVHGDNVVVEILPRNQWKGRNTALSEDGDDAIDNEHSRAMPTGRVVGIVQRNWRDYVATFSLDELQPSPGQSHKTSKVLVIPYDRRIPKIRINTRQRDSLKDHKIVVRIDSWDVDSQYPNGHFVRSLGKSGELETEVSAILVEYNLSMGTFSEGILKEMPVNTVDNPWQMSRDEVASRLDIRDSHLVFSIDPKGCEDVDDTLSVRILDDGRRELGVHIADVSHFVRPGSLTDLEAQARSTTVYLADRRYDMLPEVLSADLCSLVSGVDRFAVSVIWELDTSCEVQNVWYGRTVIRSQYKLFYEMAQSIHDGASNEDIVQHVPELQSLTDERILHERISILRSAITSLMDIARHLKARRLVDGALELEGSEVQVRLDDTRQVENLIPKQPLEVHETIAECMIFANHWVAKKIYQHFPQQSLLRHHPLPLQEQFDMLKQCALSRGFDIVTNSNKTLAQSLETAVDPSDPVVNKLLRTLATLAMSQASYFCTGSLSRDQFFHYGLALDFYTHFTSPIRRYADVIVHRLLMRCVSCDHDDKGLLSNKELTELSRHINTKHRSSQHAQRESQELFQVLYFKNRPPEDPACSVDGVIFQIRANGFLIYIPRYSIKGGVYLRNRSGEVISVHLGKCEWVPGKLSITDTTATVDSVHGSHTYHIFDHVTVRITLAESHAHSSTLKFDLISNSPHLADGEYELAGDLKTNIVKEVGVIKEQQEREAKEQNESIPLDITEYSQSSGSLYQVFEQIKFDALTWSSR